MQIQPSTKRPKGILTPGGLVLPGPRAGLKGFYRWQVRDAKGRVETPLDPRGRPIRYSGQWLPNLITDRGLNAVGTVYMWGTTYRGFLALGTGSAAPATTDASLDSEVQRGATTAASSDPVTILDAGANVFRSTHLRDVQVTMSADRNLTEFGLSHEGSVGVNIRELFRDEMGDPVTISLLSGKTLRLQHTLIIELPAPASGTAGTFDIEEYDAANALVGTTEYAYTGGGTGSAFHVFGAWSPTNQHPDSTVSTNSALAWRLTSGTYNRVTLVPGQGSSTGTAAVPQAYVGDSFERVKRYTIPTTTSQYLGTWNGIGFYGGISGGMAFCFTSPATFTKAVTHTFRVGIVSSWARA